MFSEGEDREVQSVSISKFIKECKLTLLEGDLNAELHLSTTNVNRPGLLLAGFEDYFGDKRIQVIGNAEYCYLNTFTDDVREVKLESLMSRKIPCIIYTRGIEPSDIMIRLSKKYKVPLFKADVYTSILFDQLGNFLDNLLALSDNMHGVLLEVSGIGVLITGYSGMGKSETAMELVHRGHRLVADDNVIVKKIQGKIIGSSPANIRHFIEIRGIGIINVQSMFGVGSVLNQKEIDLVIELKEWNIGMELDRLGDTVVYENILGLDIPKLTTPVMPGRNLAIVTEVAARNERLKKLGFNATAQLLANVNFGTKE